MRCTLLLVSLAMLSAETGASTHRATPEAIPPTAAAPRVVAHAMLPGLAHTDAGGLPDDLRSWAFRGQRMGPLRLGGELLPGVHVSADADTDATWGSYGAVRVTVSNGGPLPASLFAQDGRLDLIQEAHIDGGWVAVEHLPRSWCGNSYHTLDLMPLHGLTFHLPRYDGPHRVQLRATLKSREDAWSSEPWWGGITDGQLRGVEGTAGLRTLTDPHSW